MLLLLIIIGMMMTTMITTMSFSVPQRKESGRLFSLRRNRAIWLGFSISPGHVRAQPHPNRHPFTPNSPKPLISRVLPGRYLMLAAVARKFATDCPEIRVTSYHGPGAISRFKPLIWRDLAGKRDW
jgi:hypothetical protein